MANYYVRKSGSDANPGTQVSPKLTIQAAINLMSLNGSDRAYVGRGVYREELFFYRDGAGIGSEHQVIGDIFGDWTGDSPGIVRVTASNNDDNALRSATVTPTASHIRLRNLVLHGGRATGAGDRESIFLVSQSGRSMQNFVVEDCLVDPAGMRTIMYMRADGSAGRDVEIEFRRSIVRSYVNWHGFLDDGNGSHTCRIKAYGTVFEGISGEDPNTGLFFTLGGETIHFIGDKCYFGPVKEAVFRHFSGLISASVRNCVFRLENRFYDQDGSGFYDDRNYCVFEGSSPPTLGANDVQGWSGDTLLWSLLRDFRIYQALRSDSGASTGLTYDVFNRPVPQGISADFGPGENQDYPEKDQSIFVTTPSMRSPLGKQFLHRVLWQVEGGKWNTVGVKMRYNSSYTVTPKPRLTIKANDWLGLANDTFIEADGTALNSFQNFLASASIASTGVAEIWLQAYSTEAGAQAWWEDFTGPSFTP